MHPSAALRAESIGVKIGHALACRRSWHTTPGSSRNRHVPCERLADRGIHLVLIVPMSAIDQRLGNARESLPSLKRAIRRSQTVELTANESACRSSATVARLATETVSRKMAPSLDAAHLRISALARAEIVCRADRRRPFEPPDTPCYRFGADECSCCSNVCGACCVKRSRPGYGASGTESRSA